MGKRTIALTAAIAAMLSATSAYAQDSESGASGSFSLSTESGASSEGSSTSGSWLSHYTPESGLIELGLFGGVFLPARDHNLRGPGEPFIRFKRVAPEIGLRAAYFPLSFLGVEGEGAVMPTKDENGGSATLWALRAHAIGQLPDGTYRFSDVMDDDGCGNRDLPIEVEVTIAGDRLHVSFEGTASQTAGNINCTPSATLSARGAARRSRHPGRVDDRRVGGRMMCSAVMRALASQNGRPE